MRGAGQHAAHDDLASVRQEAGDAFHFGRGNREITRDAFGGEPAEIDVAA
jgi:hypothetical protein